MNEQRERAELETVLASTMFTRAPDLSKILRYICEKHLSNQADKIKEYTIAVEALGRGPDFRPEEDSIVRVQAARLRKHLKRYYETDGADHPLQIRISAAGYKPEFVDVGSPESSSVASESDVAGVLEHAGAPRSRPSRRKLVLMLALVAAAAIVAVTLKRTPVANSTPAPGPPSR